MRVLPFGYEGLWVPGAPVFRRRSVPLPAAGSAWSFVAPAGLIIEILSFNTEISVAVGGGNIFFHCGLTDPNGTFLRSNATTAFSSAATWNVSTFPGAQASAGSDNKINVPWPTHGAVLLPGSSLFTAVSNQGATDAFTLIELWTIETILGGEDETRNWTRKVRELFGAHHEHGIHIDLDLDDCPDDMRAMIVAHATGRDSERRGVERGY